MGTVRTVAGDIAPEKLGFTQSHEHLFLAKGRSWEVNPALCIDDPERSLAELLSYREAGGRSLVDAQPVGCGRSARVLRALSEKSGVGIVASTGFHKAVFYPSDHWLFSMPEEELRALYIRELTVGMAEDCDNVRPAVWTDIRAGQVKAALDACGLEGPYEKLFRAACGAAAETGAPLMIHVERGADAPALADFLEAEGLAPGRMIFCHLDRAEPDLEVHKRLAARGCFLEYDTIGRFKYHSDEREAEILLELAAAGHAGRILLSLDTTRARLRAYGGEPGLDYLIRVFLPLLRERGGEELARRAMLENPPRALGAAWR